MIRIVLRSALCAIALCAGASGQQCEFTESGSLGFSESKPNDLFGYSVAIDDDLAVVGSYGRDDNLLNNSGKAYVYYFNGQRWSLVSSLSADDPGANDTFGQSVAIHRDGPQTWIIVGAPGKTEAGAGSGAAYIFTSVSSSITAWQQQAKLVPSDGAANDFFGFSVAIEADHAVIGAYGDDDDGAGTGSAYIFSRSGATWTQDSKLASPEPEELDEFGFSVATDGDVIAVGSRKDNTAAFSGGSVFVYRNFSGNWLLDTELTASDGASGDNLGTSVAVDADQIVAGSPFDDDAGASSGSAYVFEFDGGNWNERNKLVASDAAPSALFGQAVAIDNSLVCVGAKLAGSDGAAYLFDLGLFSATETEKFTDGDSTDGEQVGASVAVLNDNDQTCLVGADKGYDDAIRSGSLHPFTNYAGAWERQDALFPSLAIDGDFIGSDCVIFEDNGATYAVVGALGVAGTQPASGAAYIFRKDPTQWTRLQQLTEDRPGMTIGQFGQTVDARDGIIIIGAPNTDNTQFDDIGSAWIFSFSGGVATPLGFLSPFAQGANQRLGSSVATYNNWLFAGAQGDSTAGTQAGSVVVFRPSGNSWVEDIMLVSPNPVTFGQFGSTIHAANDSLLFIREFNTVHVFERGAGWTHSQALTPPAPDGEVAFGFTMDGDNSRMLIAGPTHTHSGLSAAGTVYVFRHNGSEWTQTQALQAPDAEPNDLFGSSVEVVGNLAIVGATEHNDRRGAAYVFEEVNGTYEFRAKLTQQDGQPNSKFATSIALIGTDALIGTPGSTSQHPSPGAVLEFDLSDLNCSPACPADVNGDGMLTPTDFTAWINAFNNNDPECDQNADGNCTPTDFTAWIANYNTGC